MDLTGAILKNRYCVIGKAGKGGSGTLYLAKDLELSCIWAVKQIPSEKKQEARMLRRLSWPHIPRMIDYAEEGDSCFLIMEYIQGSTLEQLRMVKPISYRCLMQYSLIISDTLSYLHSQRPPICFADLKPANLMLAEDGRLYLLDFGSAGPATNGIRRSSCEGTQGFAAPEQYEGILMPQSDIYAFGRTLEVLSTKKIRLLHPELFLFIRKCTRRDHKLRFETALETGRFLRRMIRIRKICIPVILSAALLVVLLNGVSSKRVHRETEQSIEKTGHSVGETGKNEEESDTVGGRVSGQVTGSAADLTKSDTKQRLTEEEKQDGTDLEENILQTEFSGPSSERDRFLIRLTDLTQIYVDLAEMFCYQGERNLSRESFAEYSARLGETRQQIQLLADRTNDDQKKAFLLQLLTSAEKLVSVNNQQPDSERASAPDDQQPETELSSSDEDQIQEEK